MYLEQVPRLLYMQHYPLASALAFFGNSQGGKQESGKKIPEHKLFKAEDFLFHLARYAPYLEQDRPAAQQMGIDKATAKLIVSLNTHREGDKRKSKLESWMIAAFAGGWAEIAEKAEES